MSRSEDTVFAMALEKPTAAERAAYVREACGDDRELRKRVEALLAAHARAASFLEQPPNVAHATGDAVTADSAADRALVNSNAGADAATIPFRRLTEGPGTVIGRYKLLEKIGEGGFGVVYTAEQKEPVKRRVALKIIKLGMDTKQVVARFEAERQALAMMDHPNIAKVLDAGATETGRPFFVMELVKGIPITEYCDINQMPPNLRLNLFVQTCHAIQHAHQKGIIHRDIKPSNILVTLHDGVPVPKVIDFGIAKATNFELTEKTLFTEHRQMIGTPAYMSPEQAEMSGLDIDTRSDIYSLGVLLYELLTGTTPFDSKELLKAGLGQIQRIIREEEPQKPSTRVSTLVEKVLSTTAKRRATEPRKLSNVMRGDLDWIVMKCLEKDRTRRYDTANGLALDVQRHLSNEPVVARSPSRLYRVQKLMRRNKLAFGAAAAIAAALVLGFAGTTVGMIHARSAQRNAELAQRASDVARQDAVVQKNIAVTALEDAKQAKTEAEKQARRAQAANEFMRTMLVSARPTTQPAGAGIGGGDARAGMEVRVADVLEQAGNSLDRFADQPEMELDARLNLGKTFELLGVPASAKTHYDRALVLSKKLSGDDAEQTMQIEIDLTYIGLGIGSPQSVDAARALAQRSERILGPIHPLTFDALNNVALILMGNQKLPESEQVLRDLVQRLHDHPTVYHPKGGARYISNLATVILREGRATEAAQYEREAIDLSVAETQTNPIRSMAYRQNLVTMLLEDGKLDEAGRLARKAVEFARTLGKTSPQTVGSLYQLSLIEVQSGHFAQAADIAGELIDAMPKLEEENPAYLLELRGARAEATLRAGNRAAAEAQYTQAQAGALKAVEKQKWLFDTMRTDWVTAELQRGAGIDETWASPGLQRAVRRPLWDLAHRHSYAQPLAASDWSGFVYRLQPWRGKQGGESRATTGGLRELRAAGEPAPGLYFVTCEVPRQKSFPMRQSEWLLIWPWECDMFRVTLRPEMSEANWQAVFAAQPLEHFQATSLDTFNPSKLPRGFGPWHSNQPHAIAATTSLQLPPGSYRLHIGRGSGCRVWVDGQIVFDGWDKDVPVAPVLEFTQAAKAVKLQRRSLQGDWFWMTLQPLDPAADAMKNEFPGWRYYVDSDLEHVDGDIARSPATSAQRRNRANLLCREGRFEEASQELATLIAADPTNPLDVYRQLCLLAYLDQREPYSKLCRDSVKRFADHENLSMVERIANGVMLLPVDRGGYADLAGLTPLVEKPLAAGGRNMGYLQIAKGMQELRLGRFDASADWFSKAAEGLRTSRVGGANAMLGRAIALAKAGQRDAAMQQLKDAQENLQQNAFTLGQDDLGSLGVNLETWVVCQILNREATATVTGRTSSTQPSAHR